MSFDDGTFQGFSCSKYSQQYDYSGYKKHEFKWQSIVTPDKIITSLDRPYCGNANDSIMFHNFIIVQKIFKFWLADSEKLYLFGN